MKNWIRTVNLGKTDRKTEISKGEILIGYFRGIKNWIGLKTDALKVFERNQLNRSREGWAYNQRKVIYGYCRGRSRREPQPRADVESFWVLRYIRS